MVEVVTFPVIGMRVHSENQDCLIRRFLVMDYIPCSWGSCSRKKDSLLAESDEQ